MNEQHFPCGVELCEHKHIREQLEKEKERLISQVDDWKDRCDRLRRMMENEADPKNPEIKNLAITNIRLSQDLEVYKQRNRNALTQIEILTEQNKELNLILKEERERLANIENEFEKSDKIKELDHQISVKKQEQNKLQFEHLKIKKTTEKMRERYEKTLQETNDLREEYNKLVLSLKEKKAEAKKVKKTKRKRLRFRLVRE